MAESSSWELSKENIQPLRHGRRISSLETDPKIIEHERQIFESEIRIYNGSDPLQLWYEYVLWVEQAFPKGGRDGRYSALLESSVLKFKEEERYRNDKRYVDIWIKYAYASPNTLDVFKFMYSEGVGVDTSVFYLSWASEFEKVNNFKKAQSVFSRALLKGFSDHEMIERKHSQFMARYGKYNSQNEEEEIERKFQRNDEEENRLRNQREEEEEKRRVFASLRGVGTKHKVGSLRVGTQVVKSSFPGPLPSSSSSSKQSAAPLVNSFVILEEKGKTEEKSNILQSSSNLPFHSINNSENEMKARKWKGVKIGKSLESCTPSFVIHEDSELPSSSFPHFSSTHSSVLCTKKLPQNNEELPGIPVAVFEPFDPSKRVMYCKHLVYSGVSEFSFEEIRAARLYLKYSQEDILRNRQDLEKEKNILMEEKDKIYRLLKENKTRGLDEEYERKGKGGDERQIISEKIEEDISSSSSVPLLSKESLFKNKVLESFLDSNKGLKAPIVTESSFTNSYEAFIKEPNNELHKVPKPRCDKTHFYNQKILQSHMDKESTIVFSKDPSFQRHYETQNNENFIGNPHESPPHRNTLPYKRQTSPLKQSSSTLYCNNRQPFQNLEEPLSFKDQPFQNLIEPPLLETSPLHSFQTLSLEPKQSFQNLKVEDELSVLYAKDKPFQIYTEASTLETSPLSPTQSMPRKSFQNLHEEVKRNTLAHKPQLFQNLEEPLSSKGQPFQILYEPPVLETSPLPPFKSLSCNGQPFQILNEPPKRDTSPPKRQPFQILNEPPKRDTSPPKRQPFQILIESPKRDTSPPKRQPFQILIESPKRDTSPPKRQPFQIHIESPKRDTSPPKRQPFQILNEPPKRDTSPPKRQPFQNLGEAPGIEISPLSPSQTSQSNNRQRDNTEDDEEELKGNTEAFSSLAETAEISLEMKEKNCEDTRLLLTESSLSIKSHKTSCKNSFVNDSKASPNTKFAYNIMQQMWKDSDELETEKPAESITIQVYEENNLRVEKQRIPLKGVNETMYLPSADAFNACAKMSSTPAFGRQSLFSHENDENTCAVEIVFKKPFSSSSFVPTNSSPEFLSPIMESSREHKSTSSSSSSSHPSESIRLLTRSTKELQDSTRVRLSTRMTPINDDNEEDEEEEDIGGIMAEFKDVLKVHPPVKSSFLQESLKVSFENEFSSGLEVPPSSVSLLSSFTTQNIGLFQDAELTKSATSISPMDPFDESHRKYLLENSIGHQPLTRRHGYVSLQTSLPSMNSHTSLRLEGEEFLIEGLIGEGAYGKVYSVKSTHFNSHDTTLQQIPQIVFKVQRPAQNWEFYICSEIHGSRLLDAAKRGFMKTPRNFVFNNGSILVSEFIKVSLLSLINASTHKTFVCCTELVALFYGAELLDILNSCREAQIIHADIKPDNILVRRGFKIKRHNSFDETHDDEKFFGEVNALELIDFGRSIDMTLYSPGTQFSVVFSSQESKIPEMLEGKPWSYELDYFGVASTIYSLLFGSYMKLRKRNNIYEHNESYKRWWNVNFWKSFFTEFLNISNSSSFPDVAQWKSEFQKEFMAKKLSALNLLQLQELFTTCNIDV